MTDRIPDRIATLDWSRIRADLDGRGWAVVPVLTRQECAALAGLYGDEGLFRRQVIMERHGYGRGDYKYFSYPLPGLVAALRTWRTERAARDKVPAYVVLTDVTLTALAERLPRNADDLLAIPGIAERKVEAYGPEILALIPDSPT